MSRENLLGEENKGFAVMMSGLNSEKVADAAAYVGVARSAFEIAAKYAAERIRFLILRYLVQREIYRELEK